MSPDRCDVTRPWRSMRGVPFGCRMIARNWYRVLKASIANTFPEKSSSLRGSRTTISERLIPIGRRKGCSTQVPFDRGRALGVLWLSRVTRLHREFRFRSDTKGFELSDEHKRTSTNESLLYHIPRQYPPVGGYGVTESPREGERSAVASECRLGLASRGGYRDRVPRSGPWVSRRRPMLPAILVIASLIAGIPLIARSASADGFIQDLGSLDSFSHARAVNELGQIVGESTNDDFRNPRATLWENGTMTDLGSLGGGTAFANDVNEAGQIVGGTTDASGYQRAFLWENGVMTDLGVQPDGSALAINDKGQIVGTMNGERQGFLWDHGTITDLGTLGGPPVYASGVNNAGQIVGWSGTAKSEHHAFLWDAGVMTDLGTLPGGYESTGDDLSNAGRIVGQASGSNAAPHAVLWTLPPAPVHDIAVTQAGASPLSAAVGTPIYVGGWVMNQGTQTESVDVTVYAGSIVVGTATVQDLAPNAFAGVSLTWNTSAVEPGSYQLRVEAAALRNETDLGDNTLVGATIEIHPLIEAMASANPIDTDVGMAVAFTCSKTDWSTPFGPYEFAWDFGDGGTAAGDTATHRYGASGTMTATCSVVDASGGNATASVEVAVYALPSVTAIADRTSAEPGTPITFTATPTGGCGGFSYNWGFGDRSSGDGAVVAHTHTDAGQYTAIVTTRDSAGGRRANTGTPAISGPAPPPAPLAAHAFAGSTATQVGIAVSFACMARDGTQPYEFAWDFGDETGGEGAAIAHAYGLPGTKTATCTVTDAGGNRATFSVVVEIYSVPTVAASVDRPNAGPGTELTFNATATGGSGTFTFDWAFGDESSARGPMVTHPYASPGRYTAIVIVRDAAGGGAPATIALTVTISEVTAMATLATTSAVEGDTISFAAVASGGAGGPYTCHWEFGDGATGTGATASHSYSKAGTYTPTVTVTDAYGASAEKVLPIITVRGPIATVQPASSSPDLTVLVVWGVLVIAASAAVALAILRRRQRRA